MTTCVILHNMIIEDDRDLNLEPFYDNVGRRVKPNMIGTSFLRAKISSVKLRQNIMHSLYI